MLKFGKLFVKDTEFDVYILETKTSTRLDILNKDQKFNDLGVSPLYGEYTKKKKFYNYGDKELGKTYNNLRGLMYSKKLTTDTKVEWVDGTLVMSEIRENDSFKYTRETHNSIYHSETFQSEYATLTMQLVSSDYNIDLAPLYIREYASEDLQKNINAYTDLPYHPLEVLMKRFDLSWMKRKDYKIIETEEELDAFLQQILDEGDGIIGYDYETTTLDFIRGNDKAKIVGLVLSHKRDFSRYLPFSHEEFTNLPYSCMQKVVDFINKHEIQTVAHNAKFENTVNIHCGLKLKMTFCTYVLSCLLNSDRTFGIHGLKHLSFTETGEQKLELTDIFLDKNKIDFSKLPADIVLYYALVDADDTLFLHKVLSKRLSEPEVGLYEMESELCYLTAVKEWWGFRCNQEHIFSEYDNVLAIVKFLEDLFHGMTMSNTNIASSKQMTELMYKKLNRPVLSYTKTGAPSTDTKTIQKLSSEVRDTPSELIKRDIVDNTGAILIKKEELNSLKYPETAVLLKWKIYNKLATSFFKKFHDNSIDGRYFTWISQLGTSTGRESSPMHQLPGAVKYDILPDSEEHVFVDQDYSCMEIRAMAWLAGQKDLINILSDKTLDVHRGIAEIVTHIPPWALSKKQRNLQKRVNFGIPYLIGPRSLAIQLNGVNPSKEQIKEAEDAQDAFMRTFKFVAQFLHNNRQKVLSKGFMSTYFGRVRSFPQIFEPGLTRAKRESFVRRANNHPVQGTCADIMKHAQINVGRHIEAKGWDQLVDTPQGKFPKVRLVLTIHDELLLSVHKSVPLVEVYEMLRDCMQVEIEGAPPFYATPAVTKNFGDCKDDKYEIPIELRDQMIEEYHEKGMWHKPWDNPVEEQLKLSNEFREQSVIKWMEGLIKEHNSTDPKVISEYAHHNTLTHDLLARFPQSKEHKKKHGTLDHLSAITYAVEQYMKFREGIEDEVKEEVDTGRETATIYDLTEDEIDAMAEATFRIDDKGIEMVDNEDDEEEAEDVLTVFDTEYIEKTTNYKAPLIWTLFNMAAIDVNGMSMEQVNNVLDLVDAQAESGAYVKVMLYNKGKVIDTERRVNELNEEPIKQYMQSIGRGC